MLFNPFLDQSTFRRTTLFVAAMLLLPFLVSATPAGGKSCARTQIVGEPEADLGGPEIHSVDIDGAELRITLEIPQGFNGTLLWIDEAGAAVMEPLWVDPGAGPIDVTLPGVIDVTAWPGFQYRLQLQALGTKKPLLNMPVRLQPFCPPTDPCVLVALPGVESTTPLIGPELASALRQARQAGATDVLGHVVQNDPSLWNQALAFAWQTGSSDITDPGCECSWLSEVSTGPATTWGDKTSEGPTHAHGVWLRGVQGATAAQTVDGSIENPYSGMLEASLELECRRQTDVSLEALTFGAKTIMVEVPVYEPCSDNCEPEIRHNTTSHTCLDTKVFGLNGFRASANLGVGVIYEVDQQHVFSNLNGAVVASSADPDGDHVFNSRWEYGMRTVGAGRSTSTLELASHLTVKAAKPEEGTGSFAFGLLASKFYMSLDATAMCESQAPTGKLTLGGWGDNDGGVMLVIWGDPPS